MIDEEKTFREKGYYSTDLSVGSNKPVYAVCEGEDCKREGGRGRWVPFQSYRDLCFGCAMKIRHIIKDEDKIEKLDYIDDDITYAEKGYRSTDLKPNSKKPVWCVCANPECEREGGRGRWVAFLSCSELCKLCSHRTDEYRKKMSNITNGENNPFYRKKHDDKAKNIIGDKNRGNKHSKKNKDKWSIDRKGKGNSFYGRDHTPDTRILMSENHADVSGENNPMYGIYGENAPGWKGGITSERDEFYNSLEYREWRRSVFERDSYTCQDCGHIGGVLNAHHILPYRDWKEPRFSLNIKNGITLCKKCHDITIWKEYEFFNKYFDIANGVCKYKK